MPVTINVDFTLQLQDPQEAYRVLIDKLDLVQRTLAELAGYTSNTYLVDDEDGEILDGGDTQDLV